MKTAMTKLSQKLSHHIRSIPISYILCSDKHFEPENKVCAPLQDLKMAHKHAEKTSLTLLIKILSVDE
jgi:hypothetical protein